MKQINESEWRSVKVPQKVHTLLKWIALNKNKRIYQVIAEMLYNEIKEVENENTNTF